MPSASRANLDHSSASAASRAHGPSRFWRASENESVATSGRTEILTLADLSAGVRLSGVVAGVAVEVVAVAAGGETATLTYRTAEGVLGERVITKADLSGISIAAERRWGFGADGAMFRLASEARRMLHAHLADPFAAVNASNIEPYPHQIDAVYNHLLTRRPLRFLLADDPGAGKTIMSGLLISELMLRGDVARCLVVAPGSLVEQWQDELFDKFNLRFAILTREAVEASLSGNPFVEKNLLIARIDQVARSEELLARVKASEWDLVIVDEAHKMSVHRYPNELRRTKRFQLGEMLRDRTRHLLLLTATPHNGKAEDFLAFMTLIDPERFAGRLRGTRAQVPDVSDVMRRKVKESLLTFDGKRLFPKRHAHSVKFELSELETELYEAVTAYVREGMNRAARMSEQGDKRRGVIIGFALAGLQRRLASSPAAIYRSLHRRRDRLSHQAAVLRDLAASGEPVPVSKLLPINLPPGIKIGEFEGLDLDDFDNNELEELENITIDAATANVTADEIEAEVKDLDSLVHLAKRVLASRKDTKWIELRNLLRSSEFATADRKLIVFTEHRDTLDYVAQRITNELGRSEAVATIHGGIKRRDRRDIQGRFRANPELRVLVATDAAGEGINLQIANMVVNYDLPWNPNRIEQRFGRVHRIGQPLPCHLWNLVAHRTREGQVFQRLFDKIEEQRKVYGDQVYDVLGDSLISRSLQDLLMKAIQADDDPAHAAWMNEIIEVDIGNQIQSVISEQSLVLGLSDTAPSAEIRRRMELALAQKLQPGFIEAFLKDVFRHYGGRIVPREGGRFEITRVPAIVRARADDSKGAVHSRYERVAFDQKLVQLDADSGQKATIRAELVSPASPLLAAAARAVLAQHRSTLDEGTILVDPLDPTSEPRLLLYLDHKITDGRQVHGQRHVVSRRFHYVEVDQEGAMRNPGPEPYLNYAPLSDDQRELLHGRLDISWIAAVSEDAIREWSTKEARPHFETVVSMTRDRVDKVRAAVHERLSAEIRHWQVREIELRRQEKAGKRPRVNSARAGQRADDLYGRLTRRRLELDKELDLHDHLANVVGAAIIIPQGLLDSMSGSGDAEGDQDAAVKAETDRRAVAAVMQAERALGREPEEMEHNNPGYDVLSRDPATGRLYFIEVKGHLPDTKEIHVSARQVIQAKNNRKHWRLAVVAVPSEVDGEPEVRYLADPFRGVTLHAAQPSLPLKVSKLLSRSSPPR